MVIQSEFKVLNKAITQRKATRFDSVSHGGAFKMNSFTKTALIFKDEAV